MKKTTMMICLSAILLLVGGCGKQKAPAGQSAEPLSAVPTAAIEQGTASEKPAADVPAGATAAPAPQGGNAAKAKVTYKYTFAQALEIAKKAATKQFGKNPMVFPAGEETPSQVEIDGKMRPCYLFGADAATIPEGNIRGLYHIDANTGEVFNNDNGTMKKIAY